MVTMTNKGPSKRNRWRRSEAGQSLVEFAAGVMVLIILLSGVLDIGRAFMTFVAIENGAGEGAVFASMHPTWVEEGDAPEGAADDPNNITYRAMHESPTFLVDWSQASIDVYSPVITTGYPITVTVTYSYPLLTPFVSQLVGGGILPLRASATEMILNTD